MHFGADSFCPFDAAAQSEPFGGVVLVHAPLSKTVFHMAKPQGFCVYCGGPRLSKEHLYADWLRDFVPRDADEHHFATTVAFPHKQTHKLQRRTGDTHARRLRCVCVNCNRGWMSDLQQAAKVHLVPMLRGDRCCLKRDAQKIVAGWAAMTAMTAEYLEKGMVALPQNERDHVRETARPPRTWRIWIARYDGANCKNRWWHNVMALTNQNIEEHAPDTAATPNTQTTSIGSGEHLFIHAMSSEIAWPIIQRWRFPRGLGPLLRQIWPAAASAVTWPPSRPLTADEAWIVSDEFYRRVERVSLRSFAGL